MFKKIVGVLFVIAAIYSLYSSIKSGSIVTLRAVGIIIPIILYTLSGVFLFFFDNIHKLSYAEGYAKRKKQNILIIIFTVSFILLTALAGAATVITTKVGRLLAFVVMVLPYAIPLLIFAAFLGAYVVPFNSCKKQFGDARDILSEEEFKEYCPKGKVLSGEKHLFFPRSYCVIPINAIASVKHTNAIEQDIIFTLKNKKKIEIVGGKKQYEAALCAIEDNKDYE